MSSKDPRSIDALKALISRKADREPRHNTQDEAFDWAHSDLLRARASLAAHRAQRSDVGADLRDLPAVAKLRRAKALRMASKTGFHPAEDALATLNTVSRSRGERLTGIPTVDPADARPIREARRPKRGEGARPWSRQAVQHEQANLKNDQKKVIEPVIEAEDRRTANKSRKATSRSRPAKKFGIFGRRK